MTFQTVAPPVAPVTYDAGAQGGIFQLRYLPLLAFLASMMSIMIWNVNASRAGGEPVGDSSNYYRILLILGAASCSAFILLRDPKRWGYAFPGPLLALLAYGILAMISSAFIPEYAFYALWKSFEIVVDCLIIASLLSFHPTFATARAPYRMVITIDAILVLTYLAEAVIVPERALHPARGYLRIQMEGVLPVMPENGVAFISATAAFACICGIFRTPKLLRKCGLAVLFGLCLVSLVLAQSRTSVGGLAVATIVFLIADRRFAALAVLALGAVVVGTYYSELVEVGAAYLLRGQDSQLLTSLSGRTEGWQTAWIAFQESPFFGNGFAAYARAFVLKGEVTSMHGAIFEVMVGTGAAGLVAWTIAILWTVFRALTLPTAIAGVDPLITRSVKAEMMGIAALMLIRASTSSGLAEHEDNLFLFLGLLVYVHSARRLAAETHAAEERQRISALPGRGIPGRWSAQ